jgi:hypothetical protein
MQHRVILRRSRRLVLNVVKELRCFAHAQHDITDGSHDTSNINVDVYARGAEFSIMTFVTSRIAGIGVKEKLFDGHLLLD